MQHSARVTVGLHWGTGLGAAAIWMAGRLAYAAAEERLTRDKGSRACPVRALEAGLAQLGLAPHDVGRYVIAGPVSRLRDPDWLAWSVAHGVPAERVDRVSLQAAQWAQAAGLSPFDEAAVWCSEAHAVAGGGVLGWHGAHRPGGAHAVAVEPGPWGMGAVYGAVTRWLGLRPDGDEWRVMGAAAWGDPERHAAAWGRALTDHPDAGLWLEPTLWAPAPDGGLRWVPGVAEPLFGPPRPREAPWTAAHFDLAASVQALAERHVLARLQRLHRETGLRHACLSGSVMLNSLANGRAAREGPFEALYIPFAPDASGCAIGAALLGAQQAVGTGPLVDRGAHGVSSCLGRAFRDADVAAALEAAGLPSRRLSDAEREAEAVARLQQGQVLGWFQGRAEFGPRALGARSIVADPRQPGMQDRINRAVKFREPFRPFAPAVLASAQADWFEGPRQPASPYMDKVLPFRPGCRDAVPAVVHRDGTGRLQTVDEQAPVRWRRLIEAFAQATGVPMLLDTSFNVDGEPVVDSPEDAVRTFLAAGLDALFIEDRVVTRPGCASVAANRRQP